MTATIPNSVFDLLESQGRLSRQSIEILQHYQKTWTCSDLQAICFTHVIEESELAQLLGQYLNIAYVSNTATVPVKEDVFRIISYDQAKKLLCLPVRIIKDNKNSLEIIVADPTENSLDRIRRITDMELRVSVGGLSDLDRAIDEHYPVSSQFLSADLK